MTTEQELRQRMDACMRTLDQYHFAQCTTASHSARCSCGLHVIKSAIRENFNQALDARASVAAPPREPTPEMTAAAEALPGLKRANEVLALHQIRTGDPMLELAGEPTLLVKIWQAMLDASPAERVEGSTMDGAPQGDADGARLAEVTAERDRAYAALELIEELHKREKVHLGRPRWSGVSQGCIACIAAIGRGGWANSTAQDYQEKLADLRSHDAAIAKDRTKRATCVRRRA